MKTVFMVAALLASLLVNASGQTPTADNKPQQPAPSASSDYKRPDIETRQKNYFKSLFGPLTLARVGAVAAVGTFRNTPEEWEKNGKGFGRRFASGFGENAIRQTVVFGLDEAFKVDSSFYRSRKRDLGSKVSNALLSTVTARNEKGKRVVGVPRLLGTLAAPVVAREAWYPDRFGYKDGLRSGAISLGINAAVNLFREFTKK